MQVNISPQPIVIEGVATQQYAAGSGDPVLLLHGWGSNIELMRPLADGLVSAGYRVLVPNLPGFGDSQPPPRVWGVRDYLAWVLAYVDAQGVERAHIVGHSFGGRLCLLLGAEHADRVRRVVLIDSAGVPPRRSLASRARLSAYKAIRNGLKAIGLKSVSEALRRAYVARYGSADFRTADGVMRETLVRVVNEDLRAVAAQVQRPTLLFWGDRDLDTPLWMGRTLEKLIPDAALILLEGAGHYSYLEQTATVVRVADHFFRTDTPT